jgi:outer membrane protein TolC
LEDKLNGDLGTIHEKSVLLKNVQTRESLTRLKARQNEIRYQSGEAPLSVVLENRIEVLTVQKEVLNRTLEFDTAVLQLRENSGDLGHTYVDEKSWQK